MDDEIKPIFVISLVIIINLILILAWYFLSQPPPPEIVPAGIVVR